MGEAIKLASMGGNDLLRLASTGNLDAQRQLRLAASTAGIKSPFFPHLVESVVWARMAAAHGHDEDAGILVSLLCLIREQMADRDLSDAADHYTAQALAVCDNIADNGEELASEFVAVASPQLGPACLAAAKGFKADWLAY